MTGDKRTEEQKKLMIEDKSTEEQKINMYLCTYVK